MKLSPMLADAVETLCDRFDEGGYSPTPVIDLGVLVANADGEIDESEFETLCQIFDRAFGARLPTELVRHIVDAGIEVLRSAGPDPRTRLVAEILEDCGAVEEGLIVALAVAYASHGVSDTERAVIDKIARITELAPSRVDALVERVRQSIESIVPPPGG